MVPYQFPVDMSLFNNTIKKLSENENKYFRDLIKELKKIEINYTTFEYFNKPIILKDSFINLNEVSNPEEKENTLMIKKNFLKGQKILIVMLWEFDLNQSKESPKVKPENLFRTGKVNNY